MLVHGDLTVWPQTSDDTGVNKLNQKLNVLLFLFI